MAQIDVSELLLDPDFVDELQLIHRKSVVDGKGINQLVETCIETIGSVQPASGKTIQRLPDSLRVANVKSFWIQAEIVADASCAYPDVICYAGKRYSVQLCFDWTNWGTGWSEGVCVVEAPVG